MRHPQLLQKDNAILVVIDMQEPFLAPIFECERVVKNVRLLIEGAKALNIPILSTTQYADRMGGTISELSDICPAGHTAYDKLCFSCYGSDAFRFALQETGRQQVLICGIEAHICVNQTAHDLIHGGWQVHLACDAISSRSEYATKFAFKRMKKAGAILSHSESALYEMLYQSGTDDFKAILKLVK